MFQKLETSTCILYHKSEVEISGKIYRNLNVRYAGGFHNVIRESSKQALCRGVGGWHA